LKRVGTRWGGAALSVVALALALVACDDSTRADVLGGAGLRIVFEGAAVDLDSIQVELWQENAVPAPTCPTKPTPPRVAAAQPLCTHGSLEIQSLLGEDVRTEPDLPWRERMPAWDQRDDSGALVPEGIYPVHWRCLDSAGNFVFNGHYYAMRETAAGACRWLLWSVTARPSHDGSRAEFAPFPVSFDALTVDPESGDAVSVTFANPYLVRVSAPGLGSVERAVTLTEERFTEVRVRF
jgi:hypothetical protein